MKIWLMLAAMAVSAAGADPSYTLWRHSDIQAKEKTLAGKATPQQMATEQLATFGNHLTMLAYRKANGEPELHEKMADFFIVESGDATLLVGGKLSGGKTTAPGEIRGGTIQGGERQRLAIGDIVHIPAGVPHQLLLDKGKTFTYFVIKVEKP